MLKQDIDFFTQGFIKQVECTFKIKCISLMIQKSLEISLKENLPKIWKNSVAFEIRPL